MKGINELNFNEATMIEAIQLYLDKIMVEAPQVTTVKKPQGQDVFVIVVTEKENKNV